MQRGISQRRWNNSKKSKHKLRIARLISPSWKIEADNRLSKYSFSCSCKTCTHARFYAKREKRELEDRFNQLRFDEGLSEYLDKTA